MSIRNKNDRIHSFVIAAALGFSNDKMNELISKWNFLTEFASQWRFLIYPADFRTDNEHKVAGYSLHFSAVKFLIRYLNQSFEFCQTGEFIGRAQSLLHHISIKNRVMLPRICYQCM